MAAEDSTARERPRRVDLGFAGGQVLSLRLPEPVYSSLRRALEDGEGGAGGRWHELEAEDSQVSIDLSQVVYVRLDTEQHRVGF